MRTVVLNVLHAGSTALAKLSHRLHHEEGPWLVVFAYHGTTLSPSTARLGFGLQMLQSDFERHCRVIAANFYPCHLDEFATVAPRDRSRIYALVTFDDVYDNVVKHALPILDAYLLKWEVFVASDYVGTPLFWWDRLRLAALAAPTGRLEFAGRSYDASTMAARQASIFAMEAMLADLAPAERDQLIEEFYQRNRSYVDITFHHVFDDLRPITRASLETVKTAPRGRIGLHSASHPALPGQPDAILEAELARAQAWYRSELAAPARHFCHPFGATDDRVDAACQRVGLDVGFTLDPRRPARLNQREVQRASPHNINRLLLTSDDDYGAIVAKARGDYDWLIRRLGADRV